VSNGGNINAHPGASGPPPEAPRSVAPFLPALFLVPARCFLGPCRDYPGLDNSGADLRCNGHPTPSSPARRCRRGRSTRAGDLYNALRLRWSAPDGREVRSPSRHLRRSGALVVPLDHHPVRHPAIRGRRFPIGCLTGQLWGDSLAYAAIAPVHRPWPAASYYSATSTGIWLCCFRYS
jgi:hypothetical protein